MQPEQMFANPLLPVLFVIGIFYFLIFRPQRQREKEHQKMTANLKRNDEVVTAAGIHGTIVGVKESTVMVRVDDDVKIEMDKSSIAYVKVAPSQNQGNQK